MNYYMKHSHVNVRIRSGLFLVGGVSPQGSPQGQTPRAEIDLSEADPKPLQLSPGGWKCALGGVPRRGSVSARLAWGDVVSFNVLSKVLNRC